MHRGGGHADITPRAGSRKNPEGEKTERPHRSVLRINQSMHRNRQRDRALLIEEERRSASLSCAPKARRSRRISVRKKSGMPILYRLVGVAPARCGCAQSCHRGRLLTPAAASAAQCRPATEPGMRKRQDLTPLRAQSGADHGKQCVMFGTMPVSRRT